jgi:hypothetical protein
MIHPSTKTLLPTLKKNIEKPAEIEVQISMQSLMIGHWQARFPAEGTHGESAPGPGVSPGRVQ